MENLYKEYTLQIAGINKKLNLVYSNLDTLTQKIEKLEKQERIPKEKFEKRIAKHTTIWYTEETKNKTIGYLNQIIDETIQYKYAVDFFIHTNVVFPKTLLKKNPYGTVTMVVHTLDPQEDPHKLSWKCREMFFQQRDDYDIFMYVENDVLVKKDAIEYWLEYKDRMLRNGYNLGFTRIETDPESGEEYLCDIKQKLGFFMADIENTKYLINNSFPFCGFWIYDHAEFKKWIHSSLYNPEKITGYATEQQNSIGLHGVSTYWYKTTIYPLVDYKIHPQSKVYKLSSTPITEVNPNKIPYHSSIQF